MTTNRIPAPIIAGESIRIPAGHAYRHRGQTRSTKRATRVTIHHTAPGYVVLDRGRGDGRVVLPTITWAGAGGYWSDMPVTPELCADLGLEMPPIPQIDTDYYDLNMQPAYGAGHDSRLVR